MRKGGLRRKLIATYVLVAAVALLLLSGVLVVFLRGFFLDSLTNNLAVQAKLAASILGREQGLEPLEPAALQQEALRLAKLTESRVTVVDLKGKVLGDSAEDPAVMDNHAHRPEIESALRDGLGTAIRFSETIGETLLYVAVPVKTQGQPSGSVRLAISLEDINNAFLRVGYGVLGGVLMTMVAVVIITSRWGFVIVRPLEEMASAARDMARGEFGRRIRVRSGDELGQLADAINQLARSVEEEIAEHSTIAARLQAVIGHLTSAVVLFNRQGRAIWANPATSRFFGVSPAEVPGRSHLEITRNTHFAEAFSTVARAGETDKLEITLHHPRERPVEAYLIPTSPQGGGEGAAQVDTDILAVFHDLTDVRENQRAQREFIANASHELKTPLAAILGIVETLRSGALADRAQAERFVQLLDKEAQRLVQLIEDFLDLARTEQGAGTARFEQVNVGRVVKTVVERFRLQAEQKGQDLSVALPDTPLLAWADADHLELALKNLVENSIKYSGEDGQIEVKALTTANARVRLEVSDNGPGIPEGEQQRVFERFYRMEKGRSRPSGGSGLGLSIVREIAEQHGGRVWIESQPGVGTRVIMEIPLVRVP